MSKKEALLAIAVPTMVSKGQDLNVFNAHKMYGPVMYPFLTTNWKFLWPTNGKNAISLFHLDFLKYGWN